MTVQKSAYLLLGCVLFALSYLATLLVVHWDSASALIYESSLAKYEIMSGVRGPTTYLVFHNDFAALQTLADAHDEILGVEQHDQSNVAKIAFASAQSPLIDTVNNLSAVESMINRNVPMLCH